MCLVIAPTRIAARLSCGNHYSVTLYKVIRDRDYIELQLSSIIGIRDADSYKDFLNMNSSSGTSSTSTCLGLGVGNEGAGLAGVAANAAGFGFG